MQELVNWLASLQPPNGNASSSDPIMLRRVMHRVTSPSEFRIDRTVFRVVPTGVEQFAIGSLPESTSLLLWPARAESNDPFLDMVVATQLGAVMTMATGRRIRVASAEINTHMEGSERYLFLPAQPQDREVGGPLLDGGQDAVEQLLRQLIGLPDQDRAAIGNAIELHYAAVLLLNLDLNAAYTLCIAGIEALAARYSDSPATWDQWDQAPKFDRVFQEAGLDQSQSQTLRSALLDGRHLGLRQRFANYVCERLPASFWQSVVQDYIPAVTMEPDGSAVITGQDPADPWPITHFVPEEQSVLRRRLLASYDARSSYVHTGTRAVDPVANLAAAVGLQQRRTEPIAIIGIRRILTALLESEIQARAIPGSLPPLKLADGADDK